MISNISNVTNCDGNSKYKHFCGFYEDTLSKLLFTAVSICIHILSGVMCYGIIWYERFGTDYKRTLANKITALICWNGIFDIPIATLTNIAIYFFGPLNETHCFLSLVFRNFIKSNSLLFLNAIIISRYVSIFWLKNPASVDDDFWSAFIGFLTIIFSSVLNLSVYIFPQRHSVHYYACGDMDPNVDAHRSKTMNAQLEVLICFALHFVILVKIKVYKCKHGLANVNVNDTTDEDFVTDVAGNVFLIIFAGFYSILQIIVNSLTVSDANAYPNYLYVYAYQLWLFGLTRFVILTSFYVRHSSFRKKIWNEFKMQYFE